MPQNNYAVLDNFISSASGSALDIHKQEMNASFKSQGNSNQLKIELTKSGQKRIANTSGQVLRSVPRQFLPS